MNGKEALAIVGISALAWGAPHVAWQYDTQASARAKAVTAKTCETFDRVGAHGEIITNDTLRCLDQGWVPGGEAVDTSELVAGDTSKLLDGYVALEESRGKNFDPSSAIFYGIAGAALASFLVLWGGAGKRESQEEEERKRSTPYDQELDQPA